MRLLALWGLVALGGCGGGTAGTNYSDPPPMAEIVATPTPSPIATPTPEENGSEAAVTAFNDIAAPEPAETEDASAPAE
jgi:hypothetical protein